MSKIFRLTPRFFQNLRELSQRAEEDLLSNLKIDHLQR